MDHPQCKEIIEVKVEVQNLKDKIVSLTNIEQAIVRLTSLMEVMMAENKKRDLITEKQSEQMIKLGGSLEKLNDKMDNTDKKIDRHYSEVKDLECKFNDNVKSGSIHFNDVLKKIFYIALAAVVGAGLALIIK